MAALILASASPRRREILSALGVEFEVVVPEVEELGGGEPREVVLENARRKARAVLDQAPADAVVLGADTEVVLNGNVLGKAAEEAQARGYLEALSGRTHEVLGGLVLLGPADKGGETRERSGVASSHVTFRKLDPRTVDLYLASGEWRDRAGAYAIQGLGSLLVERLEGDFSNVVGLPVGLLLELAPELLRAGGPPVVL
jgi:septum formation protein